jgi:hypothetical protein
MDKSNPRPYSDGSGDPQAQRTLRPGSDRPAESADRSLDDRPKDPNAWTNKGHFPPGVDEQDVRDPGSQTPGATTVDNRSGEDRKRGQS